MNSKRLILLAIFGLLSLSGEASAKNWILEMHPGYNLKFSSSDKDHVKEYKDLVDNGIVVVTSFFTTPFPQLFAVIIHPDRHSLDSTWQKDWNIPGFKSECWMVASGVASWLNMLSPKTWDNASCEHSYKEIRKTQQVITHELVHVYHGQFNASPDFGNTEGIDWFVEGLATYASGQCDSVRIAEVKNAIFNKKIPGSLDEFWTGKLRYGLSGTVVMYIDNIYGRERLKQLLPFNKKSSLLSALKLTETELLEKWKAYMLNI